MLQRNISIRFGHVREMRDLLAEVICSEQIAPSTAKRFETLKLDQFHPYIFVEFGKNTVQHHWDY